MPDMSPKLSAFLDQIPDLQESQMRPPVIGLPGGQLDREIKARRRRLRDAYAWGLVSSSSIGRQTVARQAAEAVTDPTERQWLIEEVADISKKKEWSRRKERAKKGYAGRFAEDIRKPGQAMGEAAARLFVDTPLKLAKGAIGKAESVENVRFFRALEAAKLGEAPLIPEDAPFTQKVAVGGAAMAPGVLAGAAAFGAGGPLGAATFWAASEFPESREDFLEAGLSPTQAALAGGGVAAAVGATEAVLPVPGAIKGPAGAVIKRGVAAATKKLRSLAAKKGIKALRPEISMAAKRIAEQTIGYGVEVGTEGLQEMEKEIGLQIAGRLSKDVKERPLADVPRAFIGGVQEAAPGMLLFAGGGAGLGIASGIKRTRTEKEILQSAQGERAPSTRDWERWEFTPELGKSRKQRRVAVLGIAEDLQTSARARAIADQAVPTAEDWQLYGFPIEAGRTREQRAAYLADQKVDMEAEEALTRAEAARPPVGAEAPSPGQLVTPLAGVEPGAVVPPVAPGAPEAAVGPPVAAVEPAVAPEVSEVAPEQEAVTEAPGVAVVPEVTPVLPTVEPSPVVDIREVERKGPLGDFIEDTKGRIGISVKSVVQAGEKAKGLLGRFLTSKGELPQSAFEAKVRREGRVSKTQKKIAFAIRDYERAIKIEHGTKDLSEQEVELLDAAFRGEGAPMPRAAYREGGILARKVFATGVLPPKIREAIAVMRMEINALSQELIDIGAVQGELVATVSKGIEEGSYLHRSYKAFDIPGWAEQVPAPIRNRVTQLLRSEYPDKTEAEIEGLIAKLLYEGKAAETPLALIRKHSLGEGDLSIFKKRTLESPEIRALLGEHKDPQINYARSMTMMGEVIANHRFLSEVREAGLGTFLSEVPIVNELGELKTRIAKADETSKLHPLRDLYTTPEIKEAFEQITKEENQPEWVRIYLSLNAKVKIAKTILSQMTHVRNTVGNIGFAVANGHWRVGMGKKAWQGAWTGLLNRPDAEFRKYYLRAVELGLVGQDVHSGELRANMRDAMESGNIDDYVSQERQRARRVRTVARKGLKGAVKLYQAEDDIWKLFAWENEKARYRKARPELTEVELEQGTATIVRNTYPTYSLVPEGVKALRRFPVIGNFVSFPAEVVRTSYHTLAQAKKELQDPRTRGIGATRLAGFTAATIGFTAALKGLAMLRGISEDDDEAMRYFVPPWQKNSVFFHRGYDEEKKTWGYVDLGYSDPHNLLQKTFMAFLRGEDFGDKALGALVEIAEPFLGEEILIKKLTEVQRNDTEFGKVYNEQDDFDQKAMDVMEHTWEAFEPGGVTSLRRVGMGLTGRVTKTGRAYDPTTEMTAMITGQRFQDLDVEQSLKWRASDLRRNLLGANRVLYSAMMRRGSVSEEELIDAYQRSDRIRRELYSEAAEMANAAVSLRVEPSRVREILKEGGATKADLRAILYDGYTPFQLTVERMKAMHKANPAEYESRKSALLSAVRSIAEQTEETPGG